MERRGIVIVLLVTAVFTVFYGGTSAIDYGWNINYPPLPVNTDNGTFYYTDPVFSNQTDTDSIKWRLAFWSDQEPKYWGWIGLDALYVFDDKELMYYDSTAIGGDVDDDDKSLIEPAGEFDLHLYLDDYLNPNENNQITPSDNADDIRRTIREIMDENDSTRISFEISFPVGDFLFFNIRPENITKYLLIAASARPVKIYNNL